MKTAELTGAALDWAVSKAEGMEGHYLANPYSYSTNWIFGGSIIEREGIELNTCDAGWLARVKLTNGHTGAKPLIAAMRCYVALKLGDEVKTPQELTE